MKKMMMMMLIALIVAGSVSAMGGKSVPVKDENHERYVDEKRKEEKQGREGEKKERGNVRRGEKSENDDTYENPDRKEGKRKVEKKKRPEHEGKRVFREKNPNERALRWKRFEKRRGAGCCGNRTGIFRRGF